MLVLINRTIEGGNVNSNNQTVGQIHFCNIVNEPFSDSLTSCINWRPLSISITNIPGAIDRFHTTFVTPVFMLFFISL